MRFTLKHLLLLIAALSAGFGISTVADSARCGTREYLVAHNQIQSISITVQSSEMKLSCAQVNKWLDVEFNRKRNRGLLENYIPFDDVDIVYGEDPWGKSYQCVEMKDAEGETELQFYSTGRDGISNSDGNDPDDLNTWDMHGVRFYQSEIRADDRKRHAIQGAGIGVVIYLVIGSAFLVFRKPRSAVDR